MSEDETRALVHDEITKALKTVHNAIAYGESEPAARQIEQGTAYACVKYGRGQAGW